jgi:hypothetical protein
MRHKMLGSCVNCDHELVATQLLCTNCGMEYKGKFTLNELSKLSQEEQEFVIHFVLMSGNIKEMEKVYKVSYPTIKKMLDGVIVKLGGKVTVEAQVDKDEILNKIKNKSLSVDEALALMKGK